MEARSAVGRSPRSVHWHDEDEVIVWQSSDQELESHNVAKVAPRPSPFVARVAEASPGTPRAVVVARSVVAEASPRTPSSCESNADVEVSPGTTPSGSDGVFYPRLLGSAFRPRKFEDPIQASLCTPPSVLRELGSVFRPLTFEDPSHPLRSAFIPKSPRGLGAHRSPLLSTRSLPCDIGSAAHMIRASHTPLAAALRPATNARSNSCKCDDSLPRSPTILDASISRERLIVAKEAEVAAREAAAAAREQSLKEAERRLHDREREAVVKERCLKAHVAIVAKVLASGAKGRERDLEAAAFGPKSPLQREQFRKALSDGPTQRSIISN